MHVVASLCCSGNAGRAAPNLTIIKKGLSSSRLSCSGCERLVGTLLGGPNFFRSWQAHTHWWPPCHARLMLRLACGFAEGAITHPHAQLGISRSMPTANAHGPVANLRNLKGGTAVETVSGGHPQICCCPSMFAVAMAPKRQLCGVAHPKRQV